MNMENKAIDIDLIQIDRPSFDDVSVAMLESANAWLGCGRGKEYIADNNKTTCEVTPDGRLIATIMMPDDSNKEITIPSGQWRELRPEDVAAIKRGMGDGTLQ